MRLCGGLRGNGGSQVVRGADGEGPCIGRNHGTFEPPPVHRGGVEYSRVLSHSLPAVRKGSPERR